MQMMRWMLGAIACLVMFNLYSEEPCDQHHCVGVVDAGSSGSRLHIYAYDVNAQQSPIDVKEVFSEKIKPGFATLDMKPEAINGYLDRLFSKSHPNHLPVYFYATAGMRLLPYAKQQAFYNQLKKWFVEHPDLNLVEAKTISGQEEGIYGWLAVNYSLGTMDAPSHLTSVMDVGGASTQVVFPVEDTQQINPKDLVEVTINGQPVTLFAHSFLGLGQNLVLEQFLEVSACFSENYPLSNFEFGKGDANTCESALSHLVNQVHAVDQIVKPALAHNHVDHWYALGAVGAVLGDKPFSFNHQVKLEQLLPAANDAVCHHHWDELSQQYPANEYLYGYCLFPAYYYALMVDGYGLTPDQNIEYAGSNDTIADWSMGVVFRQKEVS